MGPVKHDCRRGAAGGPQRLDDVFGNSFFVTRHARDGEQVEDGTAGSGQIGGNSRHQVTPRWESR